MKCFKSAVALAVCGSFWGGVAFAAPHEEAVSELNELLRGELSAIETYRQALEKVGTDPEAKTLQGIMSDHQAAANSIRSQVQKLGGTPSKDSGAWGTFAQSVEGTAKIFGNAAALKALKEGEEHGLKEHKEVVADNDVPADIRSDIERTFIPKQEAHIQTLDRLIDRVPNLSEFFRMSQQGQVAFR